MVSRRKILSRSRDDLNLDSDNLQDSDPNGDLNPYNYRNNRRINLDTEDDVWYHKDKLYKVGSVLFLADQTRDRFHDFVGSCNSGFLEDLRSHESAKDIDCHVLRKVFLIKPF